MKFAENIITLRKQVKVSSNELADILGIDRVSIWRYEKGERLPGAEILIKIADLFHVSTDWLLGRDTSKDGQLPNFTGKREMKRLKKIEKLKKELAKLEGAQMSKAQELRALTGEGGKPDEKET
jgi:transcriptional regulator with XRE-family HTH domain